MQFPKIFTGCTVRWGKAKYKETGNVKEAPLPEEGEENGENLIRDHWTQGTGSITDMRVVNTDAVSYQSKTLEKCLETSEFKKEEELPQRLFKRASTLHSLCCLGGWHYWGQDGGNA